MPTPEPIGPLRNLAARRRMAHGVLLCECLCRALWPVAVLAGTLVSLALLDILPALGGWLHAAVLAAGGIGAVVLAVRGVRHTRWPDAAAVDRRLEVASGLHHRPLSVITDHPAVETPLTRALWQAHQARMLAQIGRLRTGLPRPGLAQRDRHALRFAAILLVLATLTIANVDAPARLLTAVNPVLPVFAEVPAIERQAWITPPAYTGMPPVFLHPGTAVPPIPAGAHLTVTVSGSAEPPVLMIDQRRIDVRALDGRSFQADADLTSGGTLTIAEQGAVLDAWPLTVIADQPPRVAWGAGVGADPPDAARAAEGAAPRLRLPWEVSDDYGVVSLQADLHLVDRRDAPPLIVPIPLPAGSPRSAHGTLHPDLTAHPWAGLTVTARLQARDASGQTAVSEPVAISLPERVFRNASARALIAARKALTITPDDRGDALAILDDMMQAPQAFAGNPAGFAILSAIYYGLVRNHAADAVPEAQTWMWRLALSLEDGESAETARALADARQTAHEAMEQVRQQPTEANQAALVQRLTELQQAIDRHMDALLKHLQARDALPPQDQRMLELGRRDLERMAQQAAQAVRDGRLEDAQQQMASLEKLLEKLDAAYPAGGRQSSGQRRQGRNQTSAVQEMIAREGDLLDHAQRRAAGAQDDTDADADAGAGADRAAERSADDKVQRALRRGLGEVMQQFTDLTGEVSASLGQADRSMQNVRTALGQGDDRQAGAAAQAAIAALQQGRHEMQQALSRMSAGRSGEGQDEGEEAGEDGTGMIAAPDGRPHNGRSGRDGDAADADDPDLTPGSDRADRDPLGRAMTGNGLAADGVRVPDAGERTRSQAISDELRRRDADQQRQQQERDYIGRLLQQF